MQWSLLASVRIGKGYSLASMMQDLFQNFAPGGQMRSSQILGGQVERNMITVLMLPRI